MKYLIGLGNPGKRYKRTRHNFGWLVLDRIAEEKGVQFRQKRWGGRRARSGMLTLFKPLTFMNRSGIAVAQLVAKMDVDVRDVLVIMDDLDLTFGTVRLRLSGSSGGHRGLKSVIDAMGTRDVRRLRLGIGPCPSNVAPREFVLRRFAEEEWPVVNRVVEHAADAACCWAKSGIELAMSRYNKQLDRQEED